MYVTRVIHRFALSIDRAALFDDRLFVSPSTDHATIDRLRSLNFNPALPQCWRQSCANQRGHCLSIAQQCRSQRRSVCAAVDDGANEWSSNSAARSTNIANPLIERNLYTMMLYACTACMAYHLQHQSPSLFRVRCFRSLIGFSFYSF